jgi:hypothetical protein
MTRLPVLSPRSVDALAEEPPVRSKAELVADGWERRYLADHERAAEARALYESLGYEVALAAPEPSQLGEQCAGCRETACRDYVIVYTRPTHTRKG